MQHDITPRPAIAVPKTRFDIIVVCVLLAFLIFAVDVAAPLGIAVGALYVTVIMFSLLADAPRITWSIAAILSAMTIAGFFISRFLFKHPVDESLWILLVNRALSLFVIWMTAILGVRLLLVKKQVVEHGKELERMNTELNLIARHDSLTAVANRRLFDERLSLEFARASRDKAPLSLLLIDVDFFKRFNDLNGHQAGDLCLVTVAQTIRSSLRRPADMVARYGGEEFAVILPGTNSIGAIERAEAIRNKIGELEFTHPGAHSSSRITVSIGVATVEPPESSAKTAPAKLIADADAALYQAKQGGRNAVRSGSP
jgi:diguanylate cyclase (GGDEF)-like protein